MKSALAGPSSLFFSEAGHFGVLSYRLSTSPTNTPLIPTPAAKPQPAFGALRNKPGHQNVDLVDRYSGAS